MEPQHPVQAEYLSDRSAPIIPVPDATVANTIEPLASLISIEYRRVFRMCEVKNEDRSGVQQTRVFRE